LFVFTQAGCSKQVEKVEVKKNDKNIESDITINGVALKDIPEISEEQLKPKLITKLHGKSKKLHIRVTDNGEIEEFEPLLKGKYKVIAEIDGEGGNLLPLQILDKNGNEIWKAEDEQYRIEGIGFSNDYNWITAKGWIADEEDKGEGILLFNENGLIRNIMRRDIVENKKLQIGISGISKDANYVTIIFERQFRSKDKNIIISFREDNSIIWKLEAEEIMSQLHLSQDGSMLIFQLHNIIQGNNKKEQSKNYKLCCYDNLNGFANWKKNIYIKDCNKKIIYFKLISSKGEFIIGRVSHERNRETLLFIKGFNGEVIGRFDIRFEEPSIDYRLWSGVLSSNSRYLALKNKIYDLTYILEKCKGGKK